MHGWEEKIRMCKQYSIKRIEDLMLFRKNEEKSSRKVKLFSSFIRKRDIY